MLMLRGARDICLVCMPDAPMAHPPLGLSILSTELGNAGFAVKTLYPNLWFADLVGLDRLKLIRSADTADLAIEWLFSGSAFRGDSPLRGEYLEKLIERNPRLRGHPKAEGLEIFHALRREAGQFVDLAAERVLEHHPRIVGCGSMFQQHVASLALLRRIRELAPEVVTMMGGANCETVMGRATHRLFPWVDYVVSGDADALIAPLCRAIFGKGRELSAAELPDGVLGPAHRLVGYPVSDIGDGGTRASLSSLGDAQMPDYSDYFEELDQSPLGSRLQPAISFESSRGCWWGEKSHCTFCGLNGPQMRYRAKDPSVVVNEIEQLYRRYGTPNFQAVDNIIDMHYFDSMLPGLAQRQLPLRLFYETKANLKRRHVKQLASAGVRWIQPGIESLHTKILELMGKGVSAVQNVQLLKHARQVGVNAQWQSIMGFPGELDEWYAESAAWMPLLAHLEPGGIVALKFQRFSPYHTRSQDYGLDLRPSSPYAEVYPLAEADLAEIAYFFESRDAVDAAGNLIQPPIPETPGRNAYRKAALEWQLLWGRTPPVLKYEDVGEMLHVEDTRPVASERFTTVDGLARDVMLLLDEEAFTRKQICGRMQDQRRAQAPAVNETLDSLLRRKLLLDLDGKIVNLVLAAPLPPMPKAFRYQLRLPEAVLETAD
jgi:ribosomal peptide maturation radical SAM protein 1